MDKDFIVALVIVTVFLACIFIVCSINPVNTKMVKLGPEQDRMYQEICEMQEKNKNTENPNVQINIYIVETTNND